MLWLILWCVFICVAFYYYCVRPMSYWKNLGVKQGNPVWLFGDNFGTLTRREGMHEAVRRFYNEFPNERYSGIYQFIQPTLIIKDPELLKQIGIKDFDHFVDHKPFIPENADPLWAKNLFALRGQPWREMRTILSPSFTSSKMKSMFVLMCEAAEAFANYFKDKVDNDVVEVEIKDVFSRFGNDVIASIAFGVKIDSLRDENNEFYLMGKESTDFSKLSKTLKIFAYMLAPGISERLRLAVFGKKVTKFFTELVEDTIKVREENNIVRPDMINLLLEARRGDHKQEEITNVDTGFATVEEVHLGKGSDVHKKNITNLDIAAQALIFFFAGFESVTSMMAFMAYELAVNPEIQDRLRAEIEQTDQECDGKITYEALMKMKYLDMIISETLRKWPSTVAVDRICTKPYTIKPTLPNEKPLSIPKDEIIWIPIDAFHHDPKYYPEPEKFDPERFSDENKHKINPYTYIPFGLGPRNCIGSRFALLECKTLFYHLLMNFELVPVKRTNIPMKLMKASFTPKPEGGNWLGIKPIIK